jgi:hypothetical protein
MKKISKILLKSLGGLFNDYYFLIGVLFGIIWNVIIHDHISNFGFTVFVLVLVFISHKFWKEYKNARQRNTVQAIEK